MVLTPSDGHSNILGWQVGGTHATEMLSCFFFKLRRKHYIFTASCKRVTSLNPVPFNFLINFSFFFSFHLDCFDVKRLIILWVCQQVLASLCCVFLLKQKQIDGTSTTSGTLEPSNENNGVKSTDEMKKSKLITHEASKLTNEKTRLTDYKSKSSNPDKEFNARKNASLHGNVYGWQIIKIPYFWLLIATFIIGSALTKLFIFNLGT